MKKLYLLCSILMAISFSVRAEMVNFKDGWKVFVDGINYRVFWDQKVAYVDLAWVDDNTVTIPSEIRPSDYTYNVIGINQIIKENLYVPSSIKYVQEYGLISYDRDNTWGNYFYKIGVQNLHAQDLGAWMSATLYPFDNNYQTVPMDAPHNSKDSQNKIDDKPLYWHIPWTPIWEHTIESTTYLLYDKEELVPSDLSGENRLGGPKYKNFSNCQYVRNFNNIEFDNSVTNIPWLAFRRCRNIKTVKFPTRIDTIGEKAFSECDGLLEVVWPQSLKRIGDRAFEYCCNLKSCELPLGLAEIGDSAFYYCQNLKNVSFPKGLRTIGESAFEYSNNLDKIDLPEGLESIGNQAFSGSNAEEVVFRDGLISIGNGAFQDCTKLTKVILPNSVEFIGNEAFSNCSKVEELKLSTSLRNISTKTFYGCNLQEITGWDNVQRIGASAFREAIKDWTELVLPPNVSIINQEAFRSNSKLDTVELPASLIFLGMGAFSECNYIKTIICRAPYPPAIENDNPIWYVFPHHVTGDRIVTTSEYAVGQATLYVPKGSLERYREDNSWGYFDKIVEMESGVEELEQEAFDASQPIELIGLTGISVGTFQDLQTAQATVVPGIYICRQGSVICKIAIR